MTALASLAEIVGVTSVNSSRSRLLSAGERLDRAFRTAGDGLAQGGALTPRPARSTASATRRSFRPSVGLRPRTTSRSSFAGIGHFGPGSCPVSALKARTGSAALPLTAAMSSSVRGVRRAARLAICWSRFWFARSPTPAILADTSSPRSPSAATRSAPLPSMTSRRSSTRALIAPATLAPPRRPGRVGVRRRPRQHLAHRLNAPDQAFVDALGVAVGRLDHVGQAQIDDPRAC